jgi:hypothetical protein
LDDDITEDKGIFFLEVDVEKDTEEDGVYLPPTLESLPSFRLPDFSVP